jgi:hypothetical protein
VHGEDIQSALEDFSQADHDPAGPIANENQSDSKCPDDLYKATLLVLINQ